MTEQMTKRYLAVPPAGKGPGVLVLHAWWGLNDFIRSFCDRLAQEGFVALAPDLYFGKLARTVEEAEQLSKGVDDQTVASEATAALEDLRTRPQVSGRGLGVVGFSMGAYWALWLADQKPEHIRAVTLFYGTGEGEFLNSQAAFMGHFADNDPYESEEWTKDTERRLKAAHRPVQFFMYPGGHWFFEADRPDAYNAEAAQLAWERTVAFLHEQLGGG